MTAAQPRTYPFAFPADDAHSNLIFGQNGNFPKEQVVRACEMV